MRRIAVENSSMVRSIGYDAGTEELEVEMFHGGAIYRYGNVPMEKYMDILKADSIGKSIIALQREKVAIDGTDDGTGKNEMVLAHPYRKIG